MPTELEELVEFLHHGNTQIRQIAVEHLVGYSLSDPSIFKTNRLEPVKDLKLLVKDYAPIAKNVLTILVNLSGDQEILKSLATDDTFIESLMVRITSQTELNANEFAMLFANLAKSEESLRLLKLERSIPKLLSKSKFAIDQLMDCFVKGAEGGYNKNGNYDYLSYFFADLAQHPECRSYFTLPQKRDENIVPLTKLTVFTEHKSTIRRRGVASTIKNVAFDISAHPSLLSPSSVNILPYILLPIMGSEEYNEQDTEGMLEDLQLLPPDKERDSDKEIIKTHLETLLLLTTTRDGRDKLRDVRIYPILRECHLHVDDEGVRESCDRLVQVIMRDEEGEGDSHMQKQTGRIEELEDEEDEDEQIIEIL